MPETLLPKTRIPWRHLILFGWLPSPLKVLAYRLLLGYRIGRRVRISFGGVVIGKTWQYRRACPVCKTGATTEIHRCLAVFNPSKILDCDRQKHNEEHGCSSLTEAADGKE